MRRLLLVAATVLLVAGCGGGTEAASDTSTDTPTDAASAAPGGGGADLTAYTECLAENGVALPEGSFGGGQRPSGMPTDRPTDMPSGMPTDVPSGMPTDMPSGTPSDRPSGAPGGGRPGGGMGGMQVPDGVDEDTWNAAREACADLAPSFGGGGQGGGPGGGGLPTLDASDLTVFWSCMKDHDVEQPESGSVDDLEASDETVKAALEVCDALLPDSADTSATT